ncbi:MAG TPA: preprotein translocase subunit YajC [bacterium]|nr:preprotein translocase subunit YajC [bacterium]
MNTVLYFLGMAGNPGGAQQQGNPLLSFLPLFVIIAIMYLFLMRPQAKKQKEHRQMLQTLEKGDKILTTGGIVGEIVGIREKEDMLIVRIADNVKVDMVRGAVAQVLRKRSE